MCGSSRCRCRWSGLLVLIQWGGRKTYVVIHGCRTEEEDRRIVRELLVVDDCAVGIAVRSIVHVVRGINEADGRGPFIG